MTAEALFRESPARRRELIEARLAQRPILGSDDLSRARAIADVLDPVLPKYFELALDADRRRLGGSVLQPARLREAVSAEVEAFFPLARAAITSSTATRAQLMRSKANIYELAGAVSLALSNRVTRNLSTTMGGLWERIANISPRAINPELELGIRIVGIDVILLDAETKTIRYAQLKTQKNTLTGSQRERSIAELKVHRNPMFCACFDTSSAWTFRDSSIPRVAGAAFWRMLGMDYAIVEYYVVDLIRRLENEYVGLLQVH